MPEPITAEYLESKVASVEATGIDNRLTIAVVTLKSGFIVTGESICHNPEAFNAEMGKRMAFQNAIEKLYPYEAYRRFEAVPEGTKLKWNLINPAGEVVATEPSQVMAWQRIDGTYKTTLEGLRGYEQAGWAVMPTLVAEAPPQLQLVTHEPVIAVPN